MSDPMRQAQEHAYYERSVRDRMTAATHEARMRALARNAVEGRPHALSFAASALAAGVPTVPFLLTLPGAGPGQHVGVTDGWLITSSRGRTNMGVTRDGHLVSVHDDVAAKLGHVPVAGQVFVTRAADGSVEATSQGYTEPGDVLARRLATRLDGLRGPVVDGPAVSGWQIAHRKPATPAAAFGARVGALAVFTLLFLLAAGVWWLLEQDTHRPEITMGLLAVLGVPLPALIFLCYPTKVLFGRAVLRIRGVKSEHVICDTCGHANPVPVEHLCSKCRRVLRSTVRVMRVASRR